MSSGPGILVFDLDGTLFHTETVTLPAAREAFLHHGLEAPPEDEVRALIGHTAETYTAWLRSRCGDVDADALVRSASARELELVRRVGRLYPGVREALEALRERTTVLAVCSNGARRYVETVLDACGIAGLFDAVRFRRPDDVNKPQMLGELLKTLRPAGPGAVVGDRRDDLEAARAHGMAAIGCAYGYGRDGELDGADALLRRFDELPRIVQQLLSS